MREDASGEPLRTRAVSSLSRVRRPVVNQRPWPLRAHWGPQRGLEKLGARPRDAVCAAPAGCIDINYG